MKRILMTLCAALALGGHRSNDPALGDESRSTTCWTSTVRAWRR